MAAVVWPARSASFALLTSTQARSKCPCAWASRRWESSCAARSHSVPRTESHSAADVACRVVEGRIEAGHGFGRGAVNCQEAAPGWAKSSRQAATGAAQPFAARFAALRARALTRDVALSL